MKRFWIAVPITTAAALAFAFSGCASSPKTVFKKNTGVTLPAYEYVTTVDNTGFFGDGELVYIFELSEENGQKLEVAVQDAKYWQSLPMTATLDELVYTHFQSKIPRVENGYYYFYDEQHKTHGDDKVTGENVYSYDFIIGVYDTDNRTAYYYEQHT